MPFKAKKIILNAMARAGLGIVMKNPVYGEMIA